MGDFFWGAKQLFWGAEGSCPDCPAACARPAGKGRVGYLNYPFTSFDILSFYILEMIPLYYIFLHPRVVTGSLKDPGSRLHRSASHIAGRSPDVNSIATRIPPSPTWMIGCSEDCRTGEFERIG